MILRSFFILILGAFATLSVAGAELIGLNTPWKYFKGLGEASVPDRTAWRSVAFNDAGWLTAPAPFWYGDVQPSPGTVLSDMRGLYTSVFLRKSFQVGNPADFSELELRSLSDDGYIAWINGVEVARYNMPGGPIPYNGVSLAALNEPLPYETFSIPNPSQFLQAGVNVLAVHAFNTSLNGSSDFVFNASLAGRVDREPPVVVSILPPPTARVRALSSIEVQFSEPVTGVDAADLRIHGAAATALFELTDTHYVFEFAALPPGTVEVGWRPDHGIRDLASTPNPFEGGGTWSYTVDPEAPLPTVMISEFMASNQRTLHDEDGDRSDWIELYNASSETVDLGGWFLTDDASDLTQWAFPHVSLGANEYLLVYASGKNRTNVTGRLHTNFSLSSEGEYLALLDPGTNVISEFAPTYPEQLTDISYGRNRGAPDVVGYFLDPTPGAPNAASGPGFASDVEFSRAGGTFTTAFPLVMSTDTPPGTVIRYTLNGSLPTASSLIYTGPISITATTQVRARAFHPELLPGYPRTETFVRLNQNVVNFSSDLPIMIIHNLGGGPVPSNTRQTAFVALFDRAPARSRLTHVPDLQTRAGIRIRGSSTRGYPKSSFSVEFWDDFEDNNHLSPLGMPEEPDWILYAPNNFEPVLIHNPFAFELSNQIGRYAPRTRFVEVYLATSSGEISQANYNGIYVLAERIKRGADRVAVHRLAPEHTAQPEISGGYILKIDRLGPGERGFSAAGQTMAHVYPKEEEMRTPQRAPQLQYLRSYFSSFQSALNGGNYRNPQTGYAAYVDVDAWIDHHVLNVLAFNVDALRLSSHLYKPRDGKLVFGPVWDFDRALGSTDGRDSNPRVWRSQTSDRGTDFFNHPWWGRMFTDPDFWQRWIDRYQDLREAQFSVANLHGLVDRLANEVREAQPRERTRWGVPLRGGSYQSEVNFMKNWLAERIHFMDGNFLNKPRLSLPGGQTEPDSRLALSGPAGATLYYTTDGTDPRGFGGALQPQARVYSGPIPIQENTRVLARAFHSNHRNLTGADNPPISSSWSGLASAVFLVNTPQLVITELMYAPQPPPAGNTNSAENFEFIELMNRGSAPLSLSGFQFTRGISFDFTGSAVPSLAPGERVLVVRDTAAFLSRYGALPNIAGQYTGNLDNAGERITLEGPLGEVILDFSYDGTWEPITRGFGFSLVVADASAPFEAWADPARWRPSATVNGSPGQADAPLPGFPPVVVNEALSRSSGETGDAIELHNPGISAADISGWFLTDTFTSPRKFRIPPNTILPAGGYRVFTEQHFNTGAPGSFALSAQGEEVYLFSGNAAGDLTGYFQGFSFGAADREVTFGRYLTSVGEEHFVAQIEPTLGTVNAGPAVGPVVINEIMYNPLPIGTNTNTIDEYIELQNVSGQTVPLFDPNAPNSTWRIGGVGYTFPPNISMAPNGYLLVVPFDPEVDPGQLSAFRTRYGVANGIRILGPYEGRLNNAGERLSLWKTDPVAAGEQPGTNRVDILVDRVTYSSAAPWPPEANATGQSLQRRLSAAYGDDPANWDAALPTPGRANANAVLRIEGIRVESGTVVIRFTANAGQGYSVLYRGDLTSGSWLKLLDVPAQPAARVVEAVDPNAPAAGSRFYRVVTPAIP